MTFSRALWATIAAGSTLAVVPSSVHAGGYDTPILYSAQHMGMGGAAIAYVDDPTAMFHNTAGLARTMGLTFTVNATLILGTIQAAPSGSSGTIESEPIMAFAPLVGVSVKPVDWFAAGVAFYPVASAGADYEYASGDASVVNSTSVVFLEVAPSVAFKLPGNINLGFGWRYIMASLERKLQPADPAEFDASLSGTNAEAYRIGAQWDPIPELQLGVVYRSKTTTTLVDESGAALAPDQRRIETDFVLPSKLGFGARLKLDPIRIALDLEYAFQSQNRQSTFLFGEERDPGPLPIISVFKWKDAFTLRGGVEYAHQGRYFFRGGFVFDSQVSNEDFPSAFGTPPTSTTTITAGFGMKCDDQWKFNVGIAHRFGETSVNPTPGPEDPLCFPCSLAGDYELSMTGLYLDFTYSFADLFE